MNGSASGTSRRAFLGRAAGAAAAVGGAGVGAGVFAKSAAAADQRSYTAGRFELDVDGVNVGRPTGVDGGDLDGNVVLDPVGSDGIQRKHVAGVKYEDLTLQVGSGMAQGMHDWIKAAFDKGVEPRRASVISADANWNEKSRRSASQAFISSVTIPALDASSKDHSYVAVNLTCPKLTIVQPSGQPVIVDNQKHWLPSNFVFEIDGVDTSRVATIDAFTWKCGRAADGSTVIDVSDIGVSFPRMNLASWQQWYANLIGGTNDERDGALTIVGANGGAVVTVGLYNLGLYRVYPQPGNTGRMKAEMYCEAVSWDLKKATK